MTASTDTKPDMGCDSCGVVFNSEHDAWPSCYDPYCSGMRKLSEHDACDHGLADGCKACAERAAIVGYLRECGRKLDAKRIEQQGTRARPSRLGHDAELARAWADSIEQRKHLAGAGEDQ